MGDKVKYAVVGLVVGCAVIAAVWFGYLKEAVNW